MKTKRITMKAPAPQKPAPKGETVYLVMCTMRCKHTGESRDTVQGIFKSKEVAEFRANGGMMVRPVGGTDHFYVVPMQMVVETGIQDYLTAYLV